MRASGHLEGSVDAGQGAVAGQLPALCLLAVGRPIWRCAPDPAAVEPHGSGGHSEGRLGGRLPWHPTFCRQAL